jgi:CRP-like cAMP-binding protein
MISWQEKLKQIFNSKVKLEAEELSALLDKWDRHVELNRNDFLIRKGETESSLFFVLSGSMRIFFPHQEDEICVGFAHTDNLICSYPSFILNKPSDYYIQALSKTELVAINRTDFYLLLDSYRNIERAWRMLEEDALLGKIEREVEMLTFTPEERYHRLIRRSPHIFQIIPRKYIASYLRMTPETLSRIRPSG